MEMKEDAAARFLACSHHDDSESVVRRTWSETRKLWAIAAPSIFSRLALFSVTVVSQAFAGHLSVRDLTAVSIATTVVVAVSFGFLLGMASALETLCGQAYGAKQYYMLGIYLQRSWVVLFITSVLLLPLFIYATPILTLIGTSKAVAEVSGVVAIWLIPFHLSFPFQFTLQRFLQSQLKLAVIACVSGGVLLMHVIISWVFVYKLRVGVVGIALTIDFSWWMSVLCLFGYSVCGWCRTTWTGFSNEAFSGLWDFFKLSIASGVMLSMENLYYRVLIIVSSQMKNTETSVSAVSICISIFAWESMIMLGCLAATGVRVANELGAGNAKGAKFATIISILNALVVGLVFFSVIMAFDKNLAMLFTSNKYVIDVVEEFDILLALTIFLNSFQPILSGVSIGSGWQALVAVINIGSYYAVGVPIGIVTGWLLQFGVKGMWLGMISGTVVQTIILAVVVFRCDWEKEMTVENAL
ncbi:hypothetical protein QQ045_021723 [Rhodiola kirilowii]